MKEKTNYTLLLYEKTFGRIDVDSINCGKWTKAGISLMILPVVFTFVGVALLIEEPLTCLVSLLLFQTTPTKAWNYYKKCWKTLRESMRVSF